MRVIKRTGLFVRVSLALVLSGLAAVAAASGSGQFLVTATLIPAVSQPGFCVLNPGSETAGASVVVVCGTGSVVDLFAPINTVPWQPIHGGAYRFMHLRENEMPGNFRVDGVDSYLGWGTVAAWRMVSLADLDYLELQLGW